MQKVKEFISVALQQFHDLAPGPEIKVMMDEIIANEFRIKDMGDLIGRLTDKLKNRDAIIKDLTSKLDDSASVDEDLRIARNVIRHQRSINSDLQQENKYLLEYFEKHIAEITARFDELDSQKAATIREMGEKIDADAALIVSLREMPFMCFADDPHAAIAAIVKADVDGAPVDWSKWPVV